MFSVVVKSLRAKFLASIGAAIAVVVGLSLVALLTIERNAAVERNREDRRLALEQLANILERPLWNMEEMQIGEVLAAAVRDPRFLCIMLAADRPLVIPPRYGACRPDIGYEVMGHAVVRTGVGAPVAVGHLIAHVDVAPEGAMVTRLLAWRIGLLASALLLTLLIADRIFTRIVDRPLRHVRRSLRDYRERGERRAVAWASGDELGALIAVDAQEFEVHYQPKIGLRPARVVGAEALIRWRRPDGTLVPPGHFIPAVEDSGLILPVGEFVLYRSARWRAHAADLPADFKVSVNVSMRQVMWAGFADRVGEILSDVGCPPAQVELEVTESLLAEDRAKAVRMLERLRGLGLSIALDDFGTGFSSLSHLQDLPIDVLKIDRAFIIDIERSPRAQGILSSVVAMGRSLGLSLVAEGVETVEQLRCAAGCGCDAVQGFLFSPAVPEDQAARIGPLEEMAARLLG